MDNVWYGMVWYGYDMVTKSHSLMAGITLLVVNVWIKYAVIHLLGKDWYFRRAKW